MGDLCAVPTEIAGSCMVTRPVLKIKMDETSTFILNV